MRDITSLPMKKRHSRKKGELDIEDNQSSTFAEKIKKVWHKIRKKDKNDQDNLEQDFETLTFETDMRSESDYSIHSTRSNHSAVGIRVSGVMPPPNINSIHHNNTTSDNNTNNQEYLHHKSHSFHSYYGKSPRGENTDSQLGTYSNVDTHSMIDDDDETYINEETFYEDDETTFVEDEESPDEEIKTSKFKRKMTETAENVKHFFQESKEKVSQKADQVRERFTESNLKIKQWRKAATEQAQVKYERFKMEMVQKWHIKQNKSDEEQKNENMKKEEKDFGYHLPQKYRRIAPFHENDRSMNQIYPPQEIKHYQLPLPPPAPVHPPQSYSVPLPPPPSSMYYAPNVYIYPPHSIGHPPPPAAHPSNSIPTNPHHQAAPPPPHLSTQRHISSSSPHHSTSSPHHPQTAIQNQSQRPAFMSHLAPHHHQPHVRSHSDVQYEQPSIPIHIHSHSFDGVMENSFPISKTSSPDDDVKLKRGFWTKTEHDAFLRGYRHFGKQWSKIAEYFVKSRTRQQVISHAQKYFRTKKSKNKDEIVSQS